MGIGVFFVLIALSAYWFVGAVVALGTVAMCLVVCLVALIVGPRRYNFPKKVRGWDPKKTRLDEWGIPYLEK